MGEIRKDYFLNRFVIISPERAKRPHDFDRPKQALTKATPFAPGNEKELLGIHREVPAGPDWKYRVVPNKFAIVKPAGQKELQTDKIYTWSNNFGYHDVVVEGRDDGVPFVSLGVGGIHDAITIAIEHINALRQKPEIQSIAYFKNEGLDAGASINHPHSQIIATAIIPQQLQDVYALHADLRKQFGFSSLYKILDHERGGERMVRESKHFAVLCPYASRFPFEILIIPLRDSHSYITMTDEERLDLAEHLNLVLGKLNSMAAPYNIEWMHSLTANGFHWYISITPRLATWAGYELVTNIIVNPMPPEDAARFYRT